MPLTFVSGELQEFVAKISFSLNLENKKSAKVQIGESVFYDGIIAKYIKKNGEEVVGETKSLRQAIEKYNWLELKSEAVVEVAEQAVQQAKGPAQTTSSDFDAKIGGNFEAMKKGCEIINEEDLIVKEHKKVTVGIDESEGVVVKKHVVAGDQVEVKNIKTPEERLIATSSTTVPRKSTHSKTVVAAEDYGAANTMPMSKRAAAITPSTETKKKSFVVDATTPLPPSDPTLSEVHRSIMPIIEEESQGATVVKTVKPTKEVQQVEGVTLRRTDTAKDMTVKTSVQSGGTSVGGAGEGVVVAKTAEVDAAPTARATPKKKPAGKDTIEKPGTAYRNKTDAKTKTAKVAKTVKAKTPKAKVAKTVQAKTAAPKTETATPEVKMDAVQESKSDMDYMSMLPDDWGKLHWVKKEKFVKELTDVKFIEFLMSMETTNAVQNACKERLKELES